MYTRARCEATVVVGDPALQCQGKAVQRAQNVRAGIGTGESDGVHIPIGVHVGKVSLRLDDRAKNQVRAAIVCRGTIRGPIVGSAPFHVASAAAIDPELSAERQPGGQQCASDCPPTAHS